MAAISQYETAHGRRWEVRYLTPAGRSSRKRGFTRRRDAETWMSEHVVTAKATNSYVAPSDGATTVDTLWERYITAHKGVWKPSHARPVVSAWNNHVSPVFAGRRIDSIRHSEVQAWIGSMSADGLSASVVLRSFGILKGVMELAVADRLIVRADCVEGITLPHKPSRKSERHYLTPEQLVALSGECGEHGLLVLVLGLCGLRWGEAAGLRVRDVDTTRGVLHVRHTITRVGSDYVEGVPKSWEQRDVPVPSSLMRRLMAMLPQDPDALVFTEADGHPLRQQSSSPAWGWWSRGLERAGLERMTCHDLRHTAASIAVSSGANIKALQRMLGHKSASMTLDVYADLFDEDLLGVSARIDERVQKLL